MGQEPAFFYGKIKYLGMDYSVHDKIASIIEPSVAAMGYAIVQIRLIEGGRMTLQIMAERLDGVGMNVDDCADISRAVSALLDVEDPITEAYNLEISSPGIDRPLVKKMDFERFANYEVKLETKIVFESRKRFKGMLNGVKGADVLLTTEEGNQLAIPYDKIRSAKLVITDALLKAAAAGRHNV